MRRTNIREVRLRVTDTHTHTHTHTDRHDYLAAHAHRGLITYTVVVAECSVLSRLVTVIGSVVVVATVGVVYVMIRYSDTTSVDVI